MEFIQTNRRVLGLIAKTAATTGLVLLGLLWTRAVSGGAGPLPPDVLAGLLKLLAALSIGSLIAAVQGHTARETTLSRSMHQALILLCVGGALSGIIVGESTARAILLLLGATAVRLRAPEADPRESALLFLTIGLGLATGLGYFGIAGLGALLLSALLVLLPQPVPVRVRARRRVRR